MDYKIHNNGKQDANYEASHNGKEKLKIPLLQGYVTGEFSQKWDPLPENQQQAEEG